MRSPRSTGSSDEVARSRRPKDRKQRIVAAAARLFRERNYPSVGIDDIGAAVGVTGPAIYRHFPSKAALLVAIITDLLDGMIDRAQSELEMISDPEQRLQVWVEVLVDEAIRDRDFTAVFKQEMRSVPDDLIAQVEARQTIIGQAWFDSLKAVQPNVDDDELWLRLRAANGALSSVGGHQVDPPRPDLGAILASFMLAVVRTPADVTAIRGGPALARQSRATYARQSRREAILDAAATLFNRRGYSAISIDEIGEAAGISGSAIYRHFTSKEEILAASFRRAGEWIAASASTALYSATGPLDALERLADAYCLAVTQHSDLISLWLSDSESIPDRQGAEVRAAQRAYIGEWTHALRAARPHLEEAEARIVAYGALGLMSELCTDIDDRALVRPASRSDVVQLVMAGITG